MEIAGQLKRSISRQLSMGSVRKSGKFSFRRQGSFDTRRNPLRFSFGRQSSLDPNRRWPIVEELTVPENLDATMQLLFMASRGDVKGLEDLLNDGVDVNSIDLDGRTALHIAACEGHVDAVKLLLSRRANIDSRDRWGSTAAADAKYYGNVEVYNILKARGAKVRKTRKTPMVVSNPHEVPEYELNPLELQVRRADGISKDFCSDFGYPKSREYLRNKHRTAMLLVGVLQGPLIPKGSYQVAKWNGTKVAVKILDKDSYLDTDSINAFKQELTLLEKVRHPNVVQFVGAVTQNIPMMIVSEYHAKGDLGSYLLKKGRIKPSKALRFALDISRGMNYLHECKPDPIIHCDLKPKNILLDSGGQLKVAGFGLVKLSKLSSDKAKLAQAAQIDRSNLYIAPEVYRDEVFDRSVDAFSFGLILYEMIEGAPPFHPNSPEDTAKMICSGGRPTFKLKSKYYPPDFKELIEECWDPEPLVRPTFSEIIVRLDRIVATCNKQGWLKDTFKLPWN